MQAQKGCSYITHTLADHLANEINQFKTYHAKKGLKFAPVVELAKLNFTYITVLK